MEGSAPGGVSVWALISDARCLDALTEVQREWRWWVEEGNGRTKVEKRISMDGLSTVTAIPIAAEEEVLMGVGNVVIEMGYLVWGGIGGASNVKGFN